MCYPAQLGSAQSLSLKDHGEVGLLADYFRSDRTDATLNYVGLGGRLAFNLHPNAQIEGEMAYDFDRNYTKHIQQFSYDGISESEN